jgi:hypothetical protein
MAFEMLLIAFAIGIGVFLIGIPFYKLVKAMIPPKRNPLAEAKERLEQARLEAEAARLNKETEQVYSRLYTETLEEPEESEEEKTHRRL